MFFLQKFFAKEIFFYSIITLYSLSLVHTRRISDCGTQAGEYITNPDTTCQTLYPTIYCNGDGSAYCTVNECLEDYECATPTTVATSSVTPTQPTQPTQSTQPTPPTPPTTTPTTTKSTTTSSTPSPSTTTVKTTSIPTSVVIRAKCKPGVTLREPYRGNCRYYYACNNGYFQIQDCGFFRVFDVIDKICKMKVEATCWRDL